VKSSPLLSSARNPWGIQAGHSNQVRRVQKETGEGKDGAKGLFSPVTKKTGDKIEGAMIAPVFIPVTKTLGGRGPATFKERLSKSLSGSTKIEAKGDRLDSFSRIEGWTNITFPALGRERGP